MKLTSHKGFTLLEMVVTVAVMAILVSITTPSIFEFIRQRDRQNEEIAQLEIRKALEAYVADNGTVPVDTATTPYWYEALARYTNMSEDNIRYDIWGNARAYIAYVDSNRAIYGDAVRVNYATILSRGDDSKAEASPGVAIKTISGLPAFDAATVSGWWRNMTAGTKTQIDYFAELKPGGDDILTRYTNYDDVLTRHKETDTRMKKISEALETYARTQYAAHVNTCMTNTTATALCNAAARDSSNNYVVGTGTPRDAVYYPRATPISGTPADTEVYYANDVISSAGTVPTIVNNNAVVATRRTNMENLMKTLGLPNDYCCSALDLGTDDKPLPFYYYSNPRSRAVSGCSASRPSPSNSLNNLPARLTTRNDSDTCG